MINIEKSFEVTDGILVNEDSGGNYIEGPFYTGGPSIPKGLDLPKNTIYIQNKVDGIVIWRKFGNNVDDWAVHDGLLRREFSHDLCIPMGNALIIPSSKIDGELYIDGEGYIL